MNATQTITMTHEIEGETDADYVCLEVELEVSIDHQEPWKGSMYTAPSDMDYYGYTIVEDLQVKNIVATDMDSKEVEIPEKYRNLDPESLWDEAAILEEVGDVSRDDF